MTLTIRTATASDARGIARAHIRAWQVAYENLVPQAHLDALDLEERTELWRTILAGELTIPGIPPPANYVATQDGVVLGFINVGRFRDEPDNESAGELWALYLDPDAWGTGVADSLIATTIKELERLETSTSYLWVLEGNARARRFYERHGWASDGLTKAFDVDGVDVIEIRYSRQTS